MFWALASPAKPTMYQPSSAALAVPATPKIAHSAAEWSTWKLSSSLLRVWPSRLQCGTASLNTRVAGQASARHILGREYVEM
jgi:hypothetical protein